jgi:hypothetical protein
MVAALLAVAVATTPCENFVVDLELRADGTPAWTTIREDRLVSVWRRKPLLPGVRKSARLV